MCRHILRASIINTAVATIVLTIMTSTMTSTASAFVVYAESIQGDLPADPNAAPVIPLLPGPNEIEGVVGGPGDPADAFRFTVDEPRVVEEIIIDFGDPVPDVFWEIEAVWEGAQFSGEQTTVWTVNSGDTSTTLTETPPDLGPIPTDLIALPSIHSMVLKAADDPAYTITIVLSPEPATLALLALGSLPLLRRRT